MKSLQPISLVKSLNVELLLTSESINSEIRTTSSLLVKVILISESMNSEIRITSTYCFCF